MAIYSKSQLDEQQQIIAAVNILLTLTVFRLEQTYRRINEAEEIIRRIEEVIGRVFEIYPNADVDILKKKKHGILAKKPDQELKTLLVLISSNEKSYGDLVLKTIDLFIEDLKKTNNDALVIGDWGRKIIEEHKFSNKIIYVTVDDYRPKPEEILAISQVIDKYDKVLVYHGSSQSIISQSATKSQLMREISAFTKPSKKYYIEPTPEEVIAYLNRQALLNNFSHKVYTSEVARLAARRWTWTKQQIARMGLMEELIKDYIRFRKSILAKQQQVNIYALHVLTSELG